MLQQLKGYSAGCKGTPIKASLKSKMQDHTSDSLFAAPLPADARVARSQACWWKVGSTCLSKVSDAELTWFALRSCITLCLVVPSSRSLDTHPKGAGDTELSRKTSAASLDLKRRPNPLAICSWMMVCPGGMASPWRSLKLAWLRWACWWSTSSGQAEAPRNEFWEQASWGDLPANPHGSPVS